MDALMLDAFNERLAISKANIRQKNKLESMLRVARETLEDAREKLTKLKDTLAKEQSDVDGLEGLSFTGLFHAVLGTKEQRLERERQELVAARLKYDQAADTFEHLSDDVKRLKDSLSLLKDADSEFEQVLAEKARHIEENGSDTARKLIELTQQIADLSADQKELDEATEAGQSALDAVQGIQAALGSAANWGTWDMFGGGVLTAMAKHSKLDDAKDLARIAQRKLIQFQEELADADERLQVSLQIDGFSKFADFFFDGLIADWIVQSKIQKAQVECSETISRVNAAIGQCRSRLNAVRSEIKSLTEHKRALIETA